MTNATADRAADGQAAGARHSALHPVAALGRLGTESAFQVLARAEALGRAGKDIVNLGIGQPDFKTPPHVVAAAQKALADPLAESKATSLLGGVKSTLPDEDEEAGRQRNVPKLDAPTNPDDPLSGLWSDSDDKPS